MQRSHQPLTHSESSKKLSERAFEKAMRLLARRDHSKKELCDKLARFYDAATIENTLKQLEELRLLKSPEELSRLWSESMGRKGKSYRNIQKKLQALDLPAVRRDGDAEIQKCRDLLLRRFNKATFSFDDRVKMQRYLLYRGFDYETINKVLGEFKKLPEHET